MDLEKLDPDLSERLRAEAHGMAAAYLDALLAESPSDSIVGVYVKGSSIRPWDTAIDYVPELSDVDIHVRSAADAPSVIESFPYALRIAEVALAGFRHRFPSPEHTPRPQLFFLKHIEKQPAAFSRVHFADKKNRRPVRLRTTVGGKQLEINPVRDHAMDPGVVPGSAFRNAEYDILAKISNQFTKIKVKMHANKLRRKAAIQGEL